MDHPSRKVLAEAVRGRLLTAVPGVEDIQLLESPQYFLAVKFGYHGVEHRFRMARVVSETNSRVWELVEHRVNGKPQPKVINSMMPRFEQIISAVVGATRKPQIEARDLRCPEDPRRLFGKLIVQLVGNPPQPNFPLLEFSCPQCKRITGNVTMHYYSSLSGELIKSEVIEPWIKREPKEWFKETVAVAQ